MKHCDYYADLLYKKALKIRDACRTVMIEISNCEESYLKDEKQIYRLYDSYNNKLLSLKEELSDFQLISELLYDNDRLTIELAETSSELDDVQSMIKTDKSGVKYGSS